MTKSIEFHFDFSTKPNEVILLPDAYYPQETPVLRLTKPEPNSCGVVFYYKPVVFENEGVEANFQTKIDFTITVLENNPSYAGDLDFFFFIVPDGLQLPPKPDGGKLEIILKSGIQFGFDLATDTPDYISFGIYIQREPKIYTKIPKEKVLWKKMELRVSYDSDTKNITASVSTPDGSETYQVSWKYDLSQVLTPIDQIGLAACTGGYVALPDVYTWDFRTRFP